MSNTWISVTRKLPTRKTRYAGEYGVPVLCYDEHERKASGSFDPTIYSYNFAKKEFQSMYIHMGGVSWGSTPVTHWMELPKGPRKSERRSHEERCTVR